MSQCFKLLSVTHPIQLEARRLQTEVREGDDFKGKGVEGVGLRGGDSGLDLVELWVNLVQRF